jgi:5-hydroxyisourate hydrolase-like protein (transthyretin family)
MRDDLKEIVELLIGQYSLARVDICIDQNKPFSVDKIAKRLKRRPHHYRNTTYLKTAKEGKTNKRLNVKHYKKGGLYRLEFSFDKRYLKGGSDEVKNRLLKVIKKAIKNDSLSFANSSLISGGTEILQKHFTNADSNGVSEAL